MSDSQQLHRNPLNEGLQQRMFKRNLDGIKGHFASPTDEILSPCSQKLSEHKNRFYANSKPTRLNFSKIDSDDN